MGLDILLMKSVYNCNITHNLTDMADASELYTCIWRPEDLGFYHAADLIGPLTEGLRRLKSEPESFKQFDNVEGWGTYEDFVVFVSDYLKACIMFPEAIINVDK